MWLNHNFSSYFFQVCSYIGISLHKDYYEHTIFSPTSSWTISLYIISFFSFSIVSYSTISKLIHLITYWRDCHSSFFNFYNVFAILVSNRFIHIWLFSIPILIIFPIWFSFYNLVFLTFSNGIWMLHMIFWCWTYPIVLTVRFLFGIVFRISRSWISLFQFIWFY